MLFTGVHASICLVKHPLLSCRSTLADCVRWVWRGVSWVPFLLVGQSRAAQPDKFIRAFMFNYTRLWRVTDGR